MFLSACLLLWAWGFHYLSRMCFLLAEAYITFTESLILKPLGYRPIVGPKRDALLRKHPRPAAQTTNVSDLHQLHCSMASLSQQVRHLQSCANSPRHNDDNVQRWFQNHAAALELAQSERSSLSLSPAAAQQRSSLSGHLPPQPAACAAAAAAMALYGQGGIPADAAAAAIGAAALFAQRLSNSSDPDSSCTQISNLHGNSSCCTVPPLEYEVSAEEQRELEDCAPAEFLCPLGRVLMTDPVCTPSGFTYQRSFIEDFLMKTGHDPARDTPLTMQQLYPNIVMRDQIATWLQKRGIAT